MCHNYTYRETEKDTHTTGGSARKKGPHRKVRAICLAELPFRELEGFEIKVRERDLAKTEAEYAHRCRSYDTHE